MAIPKNEPKEITQAFEAGRKEYEREHGIDQKRDVLKEQYRSRSSSKNFER